MQPTRPPVPPTRGRISGAAGGAFLLKSKTMDSANTSNESDAAQVDMQWPPPGTCEKTFPLFAHDYLKQPRRPSQTALAPSTAHHQQSSGDRGVTADFFVGSHPGPYLRRRDVCQQQISIVATRVLNLCSGNGWRLHELFYHIMTRACVSVPNASWGRIQTREVGS
jgi:hypothetical protein